MRVEFNKDSFKETRKLKGFSMLQLAELAGISRESVSIWERGVRVPEPKYIRILAQALKVDVSKISNMEPENKLSAIELSKTRDTLVDYVLEDSVLNERIDTALNIITTLKNELSQIKFILKALTLALDSIFYIKDKNCKFVIANDAFLKNIALPTKYKVLNKTDSDFFPVREAQSNTEEDKNVIISGKKIVNREDYIPGSRKKKIGLKTKIPIFDSKGNIAGLIALFTDMTEQREAERNRILLEKLLDGVDSIVFIVKKVNKPNRALDMIFINSKTIQLFGIEKPDIPNLTEFWMKAAPKSHDRLLKRINEAKSFPFTCEYYTEHTITKKPSLFTETIYNPIKDYYFCVSNDITEKVEQNKTINLLKTSLDDTHENILCISKRLKEKNIPTDVIAYATKLSVEEINSL
jgi:transcriptional regulator with XRE-family HTH domain